MYEIYKFQHCSRCAHISTRADADNKCDCKNVTESTYSQNMLSNINNLHITHQINVLTALKIPVDFLFICQIIQTVGGHCLDKIYLLIYFSL